MTEQLQQDLAWYRALSLSDRWSGPDAARADIRGAGDGVPAGMNAESGADTPERAHRRLERWRQIGAFRSPESHEGEGGETLFRQRLEHDGLGEEDLLALLAESPEQ
ncbi:MAG: hypothetical protein MI919_35585, partial [Holophagales bacterium]|nr:hypothetical protein [Holophagales bacterium]